MNIQNNRIIYYEFLKFISIKIDMGRKKGRKKDIMAIDYSKITK